MKKLEKSEEDLTRVVSYVYVQKRRDAETIVIEEGEKKGKRQKENTKTGWSYLGKGNHGLP